VTLIDFLRILWRRKLLILFVTAAVIGLAFGGLKTVKPEYESSTTLALSPKDANSIATITIFASFDPIVPIYADTAGSRTTRRLAQQALGDRKLASTSVTTFAGTPIFKITARSTQPVLARDSAQALTEALLGRVDSNEVGIPALRLAELDRAELPTTPVYPRKKLTYMVAALLGLGLGIGAALLRQNLSTKITTVDELAAVSGVPVYAEIPEEIAVLRLKTPDALVNDSRLAVVAEALRELRTNLVFAESNVRSVAVTSPDGSHGKTTVSFGLAATFARSGTKTLLVDCDLRRGRVAEMLDKPRSPGLMEVLLGDVPIGETIHHASGMLDIVTSGRRAGDPSELLTNEFPAVLSRLEEQYEAIVLDCPPVVPISDARVIARYADATLIVASAGAVRRRQIRAAVDRLELIAVRPTAVVLNHSRSVHGSKYYVQHGDYERDDPRHGIPG
jgi:capsular exopolysaccharide synthesis family protein